MELARPVKRSSKHGEAAQGGPGGDHEGGPAQESAGLSVGVLDRDSGLVVVLAKRMERLGWTHRVLPSRTSAKAIAAMDFDAVVVDPDVLGARRWNWLKSLCAERPELGVIVCTGSSTVEERVLALRLGADDCLAKPCHPEELVARVEAVTMQARRSLPVSREPRWVGEVEIRPDQFQAFVGGRSLRLTRREYQLMGMLARSPGEVLARDEIYERLWGFRMDRSDRSVDVFVHKLRRKLEEASPGWRYIHTHFRYGYRLAAERLDAPEPELTPARRREPIAA